MVGTRRDLWRRSVPEPPDRQRYASSFQNLMYFLQPKLLSLAIRDDRVTFVTLGRSIPVGFGLQQLRVGITRSLQ